MRREAQGDDDIRRQQSLPHFVKCVGRLDLVYQPAQGGRVKDDLLKALRAYHADVFEVRSCPECGRYIPDEAHEEDCPWAWILEGK